MSRRRPWLGIVFLAACVSSVRDAPQVRVHARASSQPRPNRATDPAPELPAWMHRAAHKIAESSRGRTVAWTRLAEMVDRFGPRLSGSRALEEAIDWSLEVMRHDHLSNVRREPVMVPHWIRGRERARVIAPIERELVMLGLGMSVGTRRPLRAEVAIVDHVDDIPRRTDLAGKIVLVNQRMPPFDHARNSAGYGETVQARTRGAGRAASRGAVAVMVRSVSAKSLRTPHTGVVDYEARDDAAASAPVKPIPAAAVAPEDADLLARLAARGPVRVELSMGAKQLPDVESGNAIGEIVGRELPDEIVLIGAHIDSWDVGDGAVDDGSGCLMALEAARMLIELGMIPRRTIRVVLFTNEENGLRGGLAYFAAHKHERHVAAIEADSGSGPPRGFGVAGPPLHVQRLRAWAPVFERLGAGAIGPGWGGADISPLTETGVLSIGIEPDGSQYFDVHHSPADTIDKIDPRDLQGNAAVMALLAFLLAEADVPLDEP